MGRTIWSAGAESAMGTPSMTGGLPNTCTGPPRTSCSKLQQVQRQTGIHTSVGGLYLGWLPATSTANRIMSDGFSRWRFEIFSSESCDTKFSLYWLLMRGVAHSSYVQSDWYCVEETLVFFASTQTFLLGSLYPLSAIYLYTKNISEGIGTPGPKTI